MKHIAWQRVLVAFLILCASSAISGLHENQFRLLPGASVSRENNLPQPGHYFLASVATNQPPLANFAYAPSKPVWGNVVRLNATGTYDPDGTIVSYGWNFGDGSPSSISGTPTVTHIFGAGGTYNVVLNVTDNVGAVNSTSKPIDVKFAYNYNWQPSFATSPLVLFSGEPIFFDASGSETSDWLSNGNYITSYSWNLGDNTSQTGVGVLHTYTVPGTYSVTLSVTDETGVTVRKTQTFWVHPALTLSVSSNVTQGFTPVFISFNAQPSGGQFPYSFLWDFGDGQISIRQAPNHNYSIPGIYRVRVVVTDPIGHTASSEINVTATLRPFVPTFLGVSDTTLKVGGGLTLISVFPLAIFMLVRRRRHKE